MSKQTPLTQLLQEQKKEIFKVFDSSENEEQIEAITTALTKGYELALDSVSDYLKKEMPSDFDTVKLINHIAHLKETI